MKFRKIALTLTALTILSPQRSLVSAEILRVGAIPDQNPEKLNRLYTLLSSELSKKLDVKVKYIPVINYTAAVSAFRTGSLDLVWFGGLTGVQARLQKLGSRVIAQRDIDKEFRTVFIANKKTNLPEIKNIEDLKMLKGFRFTYGSESSTSGRLMPQYFLKVAGVKNTDFRNGYPGFSGSHDSTLLLVQSGSYEVGALNEQVWLSNIKEGRVNPSKVHEIFRTPPYADYHWLAQPNLDSRFGKNFTDKLQNTLLSLSHNKPKESQILSLFGAQKFIESDNSQYTQIETIGREIGKIK